MMENQTEEPRNTRGQKYNGQPGESEEEKRAGQLRDALSAMVMSRIQTAQDARTSSGIEDVWEEAEDLFEGRDALTVDASGRANVQGKVSTRQDSEGNGAGNKSRILLNIIKPKTVSAVSRVQEMLVPHDEKPWEIEPTPIPELDEAIDAQDDSPVQLADGATQPAHLVAQMVKDQASDAAKAMGLWIEDQFVMGKNDRKAGTVYAEMRKAIHNAGKLGTGVLKGPYMIARKFRRWSIEPKSRVAALEIEIRPCPTSKSIDPRDLFPDPSCGDDVHNGSYIIERDYLTARQLRDLADDDTYDRAAIAQALRDGPVSRARDPMRSRDSGIGVVQDSEVYETFYYYGDVDIDTMAAMGLDSDTEGLTEDERVLASVPAIITIVNGQAIKAVVNPLETGAFPYDLFVWEPVSGQPWGRGVPSKGAAPQKILTAAIRRMMENAGMSAGPQVVTAGNGCIVPSDGSNAIVGRKHWNFFPNDMVDDVRKAFAVFNIPSMQRELLEILRMALEMLDQLTNLPLLLQGMAGAAPETLGGMELLMQNSNSPLRVIAKQFDDQIIVPHMGRYYDLGMQIAPENCRGDSRIVARGSTALIQREMAKELLMQLFPIADDPVLRIDKAKLLKELASGHGFNLKAIQYTDDEWKAKQEEMSKQGPPQDPAMQVAQVRSEALIQAAQLRVQDAQQERQFKAQESAQDRQAAAQLQQMEREIEMMRLAGHENVSLASIKAMLAGKAMDDKTKRELKAADFASRASEMELARDTGNGI